MKIVKVFVILSVMINFTACDADLGIQSNDSLLSMKPLNMPAKTDTSVFILSCQNLPSPQITLEGTMSLSGLSIKLIFRNNIKGIHERIEEVDNVSVLIPVGQQIVIPKQTILGGIGGSLNIFLQLTSDVGNVLTNEIYLGKCAKDMIKKLFINHTIPVHWQLHSAFTTNCQNSPGPWIGPHFGSNFAYGFGSLITLDGDITLVGVNATLIFKDNANNEIARAAPISLSVPIYVTFPKQPVLGGVGGNTRIYMQFIDGSDQHLGQEVYLGKCIQLSK